VTDKLHPTLYDIVPSVASVVSKRFRHWVEREDVIQECWLWATLKNRAFCELLDEPDPEKRVQNEKRIAWQMKRVAERYARKEKANKSGYQTSDESFYETTTIAQLLPFVISSVVSGVALQQAQEMINDGTPKKPSVPAESGNLLAMLIDIKRGYLKLEVEEKDILEKRYLDSWTLERIAQYFECAISTADRRCASAMRKLQENLGGNTPWN